MIFNEDGSITFDKFDNYKLREAWRLINFLVLMTKDNPILDHYLRRLFIGDAESILPVLEFIKILHVQVDNVAGVRVYCKAYIDEHVTVDNWTHR